MRIVKAYNRIPQGCVERFIPAHVLEDTIFSRMGILTGGLSTSGSGFFIKRPGSRTYHIMILTLSGKGKFVMEDDKSALAGGGDIFFSHAQGQGHAHFPYEAPWTFLWLQFYADRDWLIPPFRDWGIIPNKSKENVLRLNSILESILNEELHVHEDGARIQQLYAELFMMYLQRELQIKENCRLGRYRAKLNRLWQTVAASVDKSWNLEDMSRFAGLSRAQLSRLCLSLYHKAPGEKVREIKMEYARALFRHFDCRVSEAAELTGYENTSNFSAAFKRYFGYSPRKARTI